MRRAGKISATLAAKNVGVQKIVAELALGIVGSAEFDKLGQFFVDGFQFGRRNAKQLSPVRAGVEWPKFFLDYWEELADGGPILFPGEVNCGAGLQIAGTHPEI